MKTLALSCLLALAAAATALAADQSVELFRDDFSRYPPGPLSAPIGQLNGAIQEYHYLANRGVDLGPWANAICYQDCWAAGEENGKPYLEQHYSPNNAQMMPKLFAPIFVTGEPQWQDATVEVTVCPLSTAELAGLLFRYHTNRHYYLFSLERGTTARLAVRLPIEKEFQVADWKELGTAEFRYQPNHDFRLKVENDGPNIRAYIDDKLVISAKDDELIAGKVGVSAAAPARFRDFRVNCSPQTAEKIAGKIKGRNDELARLQADNPKPKLWKKIETPKFGAGRNIRFGDLDGDGVPEIVIGQLVQKVIGDTAVEISCLTAMTLDGKVLWQIGRPDPRNGLLTCDTAFQIHDLDGNGRGDIVMCKDFRIQVLDGRTGQVKRSIETPKITSYPDNPESSPKTSVYERCNGDSLLFVNFSGDQERREIVLKDRYWNFWVFDRDLRFLFTGQGMLGHYPFAAADPDSGRDLLAIGYSLWDGSGKQLWSNDQKLKQHCDSVFVGNLTDDPKAEPLAYYCCSDEGFVLADRRGVIRQHVRVGHTQTACVGKFRPEMPGLQYMTVNFWKNPGIVSLFDPRGQLLQQEEPIHSGSPLLPVNWRGDGQEFVLLSGSVKEGGMIDGQMRRVVQFPDDGHPDLCATVANLTGDVRDEIVLWDQDRMWIYTQDKPFNELKIYAPQRNPDYNDSNYRINYSLPAWKSTAGDDRVTPQGRR